MEPQIISEEQDDFIRDRLLQRQKEIRAIVAWPKINRSNVEPSLAFVWSPPETASTVEGASHWKTIQAATSSDFQNSLADAKLSGVEIKASAFAELFSLFDTLFSSNAHLSLYPFNGENWQAFAPLESMPFFSRLSPSAYFRTYLIFALPSPLS